VRSSRSSSSLQARPRRCPEAPRRRRPARCTATTAPRRATHWVTPTPVTGDYAYELSLGFLLTSAGPGRTAIFGCRAGSADQYLSKDPGCEGYTRLGTYGWVDDERPSAPSAALYRCLRPGVAHFASFEAGCEGYRSEGRLGYVRVRQSALARYISGSHWVTSGSAAAGWRLESVLGFLLDSGGPDRRALYECASGGDRFLSLDPGCEGRSELGLSGYLYGAPPGREPVTPVYRCRVGSDHFASPDAGCEGQVQEGLLGYARSRQDAINRAYSPSTGSHWVTTGAIGPGWFFEFTLGYALSREGPDRTALFGCLHGAADHFLSLDAGCEGQRTLAARGASTRPRPRASRRRPSIAASPAATTTRPATPHARVIRPRACSATPARTGPSRHRHRPCRCASRARRRTSP